MADNVIIGRIRMNRLSRFACGLAMAAMLCGATHAVAQTSMGDPLRES
jgi:hypothetical protein